MYKVFLIFQNFSNICAQNSVKILANPYSINLLGGYVGVSHGSKWGHLGGQCRGRSSSFREESELYHAWRFSQRRLGYECFVGVGWCWKFVRSYHPDVRIHQKLCLRTIGSKFACHIVHWRLEAEARNLAWIDDHKWEFPIFYRQYFLMTFSTVTTRGEGYNINHPIHT